MSKKIRFQVNESVWACDKSVYYAAKVLRFESLGPVNKYFVHYNNWDRKYDAWIDEKLIEPWNNGQPPAATIQQNDLKKGKSGKKGASKASEEKSLPVAEEKTPADVEEKVEKVDESTIESPVTRQGRKRKQETPIDDAGESDNVPPPVISYSTKASYKKAARVTEKEGLIQDPEEQTYHLKFNIPNDLKRHMVDEWMIITQEKPGRLLKLPKPANRTVNALLKHYMEDRKQKLDESQMRNIKELVAALPPFFDRMLPSVLLYRQERAQYDALMQTFPQGKPSEIYGGEHFVRLYVRLPRFMSNLFGPQVHAVHAHLVDLLKFIGKNVSQYANIHNYALDEDAMNIKEAEETETDDFLGTEGDAEAPKRRGRPPVKSRK